MQGGIFFYAEGSLYVSAFTGTDTEFNNVATGLATVWDMVNKILEKSTQEVISLIYCPVESKLVANLTSHISYTVFRARLDGEEPSCDAGSRLANAIQQDVI